MEQSIAESLIGQGDDRQFAMPPPKLSEFISLVRERFEEAAREGEGRAVEGAAQQCFSEQKNSGPSDGPLRSRGGTVQ